MSQTFQPAEILTRPRGTSLAVLLIAASAAVTAAIVLTQLLAHELAALGYQGVPLLAGVPPILLALNLAVCLVVMVLLLRDPAWRPAAALLVPLCALVVAAYFGPIYPPLRGFEWSLAVLRSRQYWSLLGLPWTWTFTTLALGLVACRLARGRRPEASQVVHGSARLAARSDLAAARLLPKRTLPGSVDPRDSGIVLGRSLPGAGRALLIDDSDHHALVVIPPGGGKTTGPVLGTLLTATRDSAFVLDPKAELWTLSAGWRTARGHRCLRFAPATGEGLPWNVFDEIPKGPEEIRLLGILAESLIAYPRGADLESHWVHSARTLFRGLALHTLYTHPRPSMRAVLDLLNHHPDDTGPDGLFTEMTTALHDPELRHGWLHPRTGEPTRTHPEAARVGRAMLATPDRERGSVISTLNTFLALWADELVTDATSRSGFTLADLARRDHPVSLYVTLPYQDLERLGPLVRMMLAVLTLHVTERPKAYSRRLLLVLDEFRALGRVPILEEMLAFLRGFGVRALIAVQDLAQIRQAYSERESITGNCQLQLLAATQSPTTREHASRLSGEATVDYRRRSVTHTKGFGRQTSYGETQARRPLLTEGEIGTLPDDRLLIIKTGVPPILAEKLPYFRHPELARRAAVPAPAGTERR